MNTPNVSPAYRLKQRKYFCPLKTLKYVNYCRPIVLSSFGIFLPTQDIGLFELKCYFYDFNVPQPPTTELWNLCTFSKNRPRLSTYDNLG